uniref:HPP family protein n=1 Tax=Candidatus Kentrum sp. FW TaxID=2126338 RepID=A0A450SVH1_9GAMM|nr:MAG: HPP family protein [Candidatus Kentron sp. FW]
MAAQSHHRYSIKLIRLLGSSSNPACHMERLISALGGFLGISAIIFITRYFVSSDDAMLVIASIGGSAVLLFIVPENPSSQPWPLVGGHLIPATIGITCATMIPDLLIAAGVTLSTTILAMYYLKCIHPPGAATALTAVVGGESIRQLGYQFLLLPVGIDVMVMLCAAIFVNYLSTRWFPKRNYPASSKPQ